MLKRYYSHGKLLLTGEYLVIDGARALALPCRFGQDLVVHPTQEGILHWQAYTHDGQLWAQFSFALNALKKHSPTPNNQIEGFVHLLLLAAKELAPQFLNNSKGVRVKTHLEFPRNWGLGSSSTLIHNVAQWADVNPYTLLQATMEGSGYDIACASAQTPISYTRDPKGFKPEINPITLSKALTPHLLFVHLNTKQNSRAGIKAYHTQKIKQPKLFVTTLEKVSQWSNKIKHCTNLSQFITLIKQHEQYVSALLETPTVATTHFSDFNGGIKSLGAWGGDFIMAVSTTQTLTEMKAYFNTKGYPTALSYAQMALNP